MRDPVEARHSVSYELPCTIDRRGHEPPIPNGCFVKCTYPHAHVTMHETMEDDMNSRPWTTRDLAMCDAGVGSIIGFEWHVSQLELARADLYSYGTLNNPERRRHLKDVTQDMWYLVAFAKGLYWARYNWVEILRGPFEPSGAEA